MENETLLAQTEQLAAELARQVELSNQLVTVLPESARPPIPEAIVQLNEAKAEIAKLEAQIQQLQARVKTSAADDRAATELASAKAEIARLRKQVEEAKAEALRSATPRSFSFAPVSPEFKFEATSEQTELLKKVAELTSQTKLLQQQKERLEQTNEKTQSVNKRLNAEIDTLTKASEQCDRKLQKLKLQFANEFGYVSKVIRTVEDQINRQDSEVVKKQLREEVETLKENQETRLKEFRSMLDELVTMGASFETQREAKKEELAKYELEREELRQKTVAQLAESMGQLTMAEKQCEAQLAETTRELEALKKQLLQLRLPHDTAMEEVNELKAKLEAAREALAAAVAEKSEKENQLEAKKKQTAATKAEKKAKGTAIQALQSQVAQLNTEENKRNKEVEDLLQKIKDVQSRFSDKVNAELTRVLKEKAKVEGNLEALRNEMSKESEKTSGVSTEQAKKVAAIEEQKRVLEAAHATEVAELKRLYDEVKAQLESSQGREAESQKAWAEVTEQYQQAVAECNKQKDEQLATLQAQLETVKAESTESSKKLNQTTSKLEALELEKTALNFQIQTVQEQLTKCQADLQECKQNLQECNKNLLQCRVERALLERRLSEELNPNPDLEQRVQQAEAQVAQLSADKEALAKQHREQAAEIARLQKEHQKLLAAQSEYQRQLAAQSEQYQRQLAAERDALIQQHERECLQLLQQEKIKLETECKAVQDALAMVQRQLEATQKAAADREVEHASVLAAAAEGAAASEAALRGQLETATTSEAALRGQLETVTTSEAALRGQLETATTSEAALRGQLETVTTSEAALRGQLETVTTQCGTTSGSLSELQTRYDALTAQLSSAQDRVKELNLVEEQLRAAQEKVGELTSVQQQLTAAQQRLGAAEQQLTSTFNDLNALKLFMVDYVLPEKAAAVRNQLFEQWYVALNDSTKKDFATIDEAREDFDNIFSDLVTRGRIDWSRVELELPKTAELQSLWQAHLSGWQTTLRGANEGLRTAQASAAERASTLANVRQKLLEGMTNADVHVREDATDEEVAETIANQLIQLEDELKKSRNEVKSVRDEMFTLFKTRYESEEDAIVQFNRMDTTSLVPWVRAQVAAVKNELVRTQRANASFENAIRDEIFKLDKTRERSQFDLLTSTPQDLVTVARELISSSLANQTTLQDTARQLQAAEGNTVQLMNDVRAQMFQLFDKTRYGSEEDARTAFENLTSTPQALVTMARDLISNSVANQGTLRTLRTDLNHALELVKVVSEEMFKLFDKTSYGGDEQLAREAFNKMTATQGDLVVLLRNLISKAVTDTTLLMQVRNEVFKLFDKSRYPSEQEAREEFDKLVPSNDALVNWMRNEITRYVTIVDSWAQFGKSFIQTVQDDKYEQLTKEQKRDPTVLNPILAERRTISCMPSTSVAEHISQLPSLLIEFMTDEDVGKANVAIHTDSIGKALHFCRDVIRALKDDQNNLETYRTLKTQVVAQKLLNDDEEGMEEVKEGEELMDDEEFTAKTLARLVSLKGAQSWGRKQVLQDIQAQLAGLRAELTVPTKQKGDSKLARAVARVRQKRADETAMELQTFVQRLQEQPIGKLVEKSANEAAVEYLKTFVQERQATLFEQKKQTKPRPLSVETQQKLLTPTRTRAERAEKLSKASRVQKVAQRRKMPAYVPAPAQAPAELPPPAQAPAQPFQFEVEKFQFGTKSEEATRIRERRQQAQTGFISQATDIRQRRQQARAGQGFSLQEVAAPLPVQQLPETLKPQTSPPGQLSAGRTKRQQKLEKKVDEIRECAARWQEEYTHERVSASKYLKVMNKLRDKYNTLLARANT